MKSLLMICLFSSLITVQAFAKTNAPSDGILLSDVIAAYSHNSQSKVIVTEDISGKVNLFGFDLDDVDYGMLLAILKLSGLSAYKVDEYVAIIPDHQSRIHVTEEGVADSNYAPDQYLTEIIPVKNMCANDLMPILKPLVHRHSFMEPSHGANSIVVVDSHRNILRIKSIVNNLDSNSKKEKTCEKIERRPPVKKED